MFPMFPMFPPMNAIQGSDYSLLRAVSRRLLADLIAKEEALADQLEAKKRRLKTLQDQIDAMRPAVEAQLPKLLKPVFKKYGLRPDAWGSFCIYDFHKTTQVMTIELRNKTDSTIKRVEVPMPEPVKSKCVEWPKVKAEQGALDEQRSALRHSIDIRAEKMETVLYDIMMQRQADAFIAKLPKKALAKLKAIASGAL